MCELKIPFKQYWPTDYRPTNLLPEDHKRD